MSRFGHAGDELLHTGFIWNLVRGEFVAPDGEHFVRDIVRSPGSVGVLPLIDMPAGPEVVLVEQYRPAYDREVIEIPAGMRDIPGEAPETTGRRELIEEAGLRAGSMTHLTDCLPSPGMTDAVCSLFLATDCTPVEQDLQGVEERYLRLLRLPLREALSMVTAGQIVDAKSIIALLLTDRHLNG